MKQIMNNWRRFLLKEEKEAALSTDNLACFIPPNENENVIEAILYDTSFVLENIEEIMNKVLYARGLFLDNNNILVTKVIKGVIGIESTESIDYGKCNNAWQVSTIAGPGYGPILYQIGFSLAPEAQLTSDRETVKIGARKNWRKQFDSGEREKNAFDNKEAPKTPPEEDDCLIHLQKVKIDPESGSPIINPETGEPEMENIDQLNYSYETKSEDEAVAKKLIKNHKDTLSKMKSIIEKDNLFDRGRESKKLIDYFLKELNRNYATFFSKHYKVSSS